MKQSPENSVSTSGWQFKGPKLVNLSDEILMINKNFTSVGKEENLSSKHSDSLNLSLSRSEILEHTSSVSKSRIQKSQKSIFSPLKDRFNSAQFQNNSSNQKLIIRNVEFPSGNLQTKPTNKDKFSKALFEFAKVAKIHMVIKKLRERSKYRKPDKLNIIHYEIINDRAFFKMLPESKLGNLNSSVHDYKQIRAMKSSIYCKLKLLIKGKLKTLIKKIPILQPNSKIKLIWDIIIILLTFLEFIIISLEIAFTVDLEAEYPSSLWFKPIAILCFIINIIMNFNTTYYEYGVAVISRRKIAFNYLKGLYLSDLIAVLSLVINAINWMKYPYLLMFSLGFLFTYKNLKKTIKNLEETYEISGEIFDLLSLLFKTICIAHVLACCWHAIGNFTKEYNKSWLSINDFIDHSWKERYLVSLYWAFTTMCTVGYGDITPQNSAEMTFACLVMLCGTFGLGYCVNSVGVLLSRLEERSKEMIATMKIADGFMRRKNINLHLRVKVRKYLEFLLKSQNKNLEKESEMLEKLPLSLRNEILMESNKKFLIDFPILSQNFSFEFMEFLALNIKSVQFSPSDIIYSQGSYYDQSLFLIFEGEVELLMENMTKKQIVLKKLSRGDHFGERPFFFGSTHQETARSLGFSTIYRLTQEEFLGYLSSFPKDRERFCEIKDKGILSREVKDIFQGCLSCSNPTHSINECPLLKYCPNKQFLIERLNFSRPQKRMSFERSSRKRNTFQIKKNTARSVMKVRFNKSLMNRYYGTINWNQPQSQGDSQFNDPEMRSESMDHFAEDQLLKKKNFSLDSQNLSLVEERAVRGIRFFSLCALEDDKLKCDFTKNKTNRKSFCPNKEEIDLMFKNDEEEEKEEKDMLRILQKKEKEGSPIKRSDKQFDTNILSKFEKNHHKKLQRGILTTMVSKDEVKNNWGKSKEVNSAELRDSKKRITMINKPQASKETIKIDTLCKFVNSKSSIESPLALKSCNKVEDSDNRFKEKPTNIRIETKNNKHGTWRKNLQVDTQEKITQIIKSTKTLKSIKSKNFLDEEFGSNSMINQMMVNSQKGSKTMLRTINTHKTVVIQKDENLFWKDFEILKEFEFYFRKFNASNVINKIDMEISQKLLKAKKTKSKSRIITGRKGFSMKNI